MSQQKAIAVLTSGGDAPGMNAAFRAVVRTGINMGMKVYGVYRGFNGLLNQDVAEMNLRSVSEIIGYGGTKLYTARSEEFKTLEAQQRAAEFCRSLGICGVVVIGGDGSFRGARALTNAGINCIGVPGTIDNDIACSEYTVGFDTAMNTALQMVDRIRDTAQSHDRCSIVEVMGRRCGDIALQTGIATGATAILVQVQHRARCYHQNHQHSENRQETLYRRCCRGRRRRKRSRKVHRAETRHRGESDNSRTRSARRFSDTQRQSRCKPDGL